MPEMAVVDAGSAWIRVDVGDERLRLLKRMALDHRLDHNEMLLRILDERLYKEGMVPSPVVPFADAGH